MSLEEYIPNLESWESQTSWAEKASEVSEKFKEQVKKASAWIARTRKDEKKAKKQDLLLANFLVKIILNKKYDSLIEWLFKLVDMWVSSNFLLGVMSLVYIDISNEIRKNSKKQKINFNYKITKEIIEFDDSNLNLEIKNRINAWIEDINDVLVLEYSSVMTERLLKLIKKDEVIIFVSQVFSFFLKELNINIQESKAISIWSFIIWEIYKSLKKLELENV